jgi:cytoskeletal protein CcmA (bactofilin family)
LDSPDILAPPTLEVPMWRKQEEPKAPSAGSEVTVAPLVESAPSASPAIPAREASPAGGHLASALTIKGEITGRDDLLIDGEVEGRIHLDGGKVTVGPKGRVTANIAAREIVVLGRVKGSLQGRERVQIGPSGWATGDILTRRIFIEDGAEVHGKVEITRAEESPKRAAVPTSAQVAVPRSVQPVASEPSAAA